MNEQAWATMMERVPTLRDYFAAAALQGWMATYGDGAMHPASYAVHGDQYAADIAKCSYRIADAMLAAREKQTQQTTALPPEHC